MKIYVPSPTHLQTHLGAISEMAISDPSPRCPSLTMNGDGPEMAISEMGEMAISRWPPTYRRWFRFRRRCWSEFEAGRRASRWWPSLVAGDCMPVCLWVWRWRRCETLRRWIVTGGACGSSGCGRWRFCLGQGSVSSDAAAARFCAAARASPWREPSAWGMGAAAVAARWVEAPRGWHRVLGGVSSRCRQGCGGVRDAFG